jgi:GNAT superfamily N-acetyltransferase
MNNAVGLSIRKAVITDVAAIHALIRELAIYELAEQEFTLSIEELERDGFGENSVYECLVAEFDGFGIVGMALFYTKYSTWKGRCLFLEDLIVTQAHRGKQVGKKLLEGLIQIAKDRNSGRLEWQVLDWNESAIAFYKKMGASIDPSWMNCKLNRSEIQDY